MMRAFQIFLGVVLGTIAGAVLALSAVPPDAPTDCPKTSLTQVQLVRVLDLTVYGLADKNTTNHPQHFECRAKKGSKR